MKIKRYKQARRILDFYKRSFQVHEPYQIIGEFIFFAFCENSSGCSYTVDGPFTQAALKGKIQLKEQLPKYFGGEVKLGKLVNQWEGEGGGGRGGSIGTASLFTSV